MIWLRALSLVPDPHEHVSLSLLYFLVQEPMFQKALLWEPDVPGQGQGWGQLTPPKSAFMRPMNRCACGQRVCVWLSVLPSCLFRPHMPQPTSGS